MVYPKEVHHLATEAGAETFFVILFLLAALAQVNRISHYRGFDVMRNALYRRNLTTKKLFVVIFIGTFLGSAVLDNVSMAIVALEIALLFFTGKNMMYMVGAIIVASNLGGAWSPFGDLSTFVLWTEGKFTGWEIVKWALLPAMGGALSAMLVLLPFIKSEETSTSAEANGTDPLTWHEYVVLIVTTLTFFFPLVFYFINLPPALGLAFGVGISGFTSWIFGGVTGHESHLTADIERFINEVDIPTVQFFMILMGVSALGALNLLQLFGDWVVGPNISPLAIEFANLKLGYASAGIDNVPMAYAAAKVLPTTNPREWAFTALALGHGGSHTSFGSATAVALIGAVHARRELNLRITFFSYLKDFILPVGISYFVMWAIWHFQPW